MKQVLIVEDILETQQWLTEIVRFAYPDAVVLAANSVRAAVGRLNGKIDLALIDLGLPDGSGLDVLRQLQMSNPSAVKIVTTVMGDDASIVASLSAGADGYLLKETEALILTRQLKQLSIGLPAISPSVARRIMEHFRRTGPSSSPEGQLTKRETEVLMLIAKGLRNNEVASALGIAETTVAGYIKIVYRKLGIGSRAEAAWHASRLGLGLDP